MYINIYIDIDIYIGEKSLEVNTSIIPFNIMVYVCGFSFIQVAVIQVRSQCATELEVFLSFFFFKPHVQLPTSTLDNYGPISPSHTVQSCSCACVTAGALENISQLLVI